jgi:spermidine synthase
VARTDKQAEGLSIPVIVVLFFVSGAAALVYQVVWARMMMHVFGSTAVAVGTVLAAFMSGMAVGSWAIGRFADRSRNCLRLYAILEIGIALAAFVSHFLLGRIGPAHLALHDQFGSFPAVFAMVRFLLAFVLVMAPTILMGATLPVLARYLTNREASVGINLSTLYASNTLGAVAGVLLTGFFLIGRYGIHPPVYMAVAGNLAIAVIAWLLSMRSFAVRTSTSLPPPVDEAPAEGVARAGPATVRLILLGLGISGFTSFAYEIYWTRSLVFILGNSTYALTTMLSAFLTGIALGGYLIRFFMHRIKDRVALFGWIQVALGLFSALALPLLFSISDPQAMNQYLIRTAGEVYTLIFVRFGVAFLVMLVPAIFIGTTFPLAGQIGVKDRRAAGTQVGLVYAVNTLGNVLGALLPGFVLLNWLGIQKGILAMAVLNTGLGLLILFLRLTHPSRHRAWRLVLPAVLIVSAVAMSRAPLQFQFPSDGELEHHRTLYYREGPLATTKVFQDPASGEKHMSVDGIVIGGTGFAEYKQLLLAQLPKLFINKVSRELSVGLGSGILAGESALHPGVENIAGVEIEPSVIEGAALFAEENHGILDNPQLTVIADDIGNFLRTTSGRWEVITADEKTADDYASNGFSYSLEYYELLRERLAPGGLVAQWIPTTLPPRQYRMVLKTFTRSFPHVQLWYFLPAHKRGPFNSILIGSREPISIDPDHIDRQLSDHPDAFSSLRPYGLTSSESILPHFVASEKHLIDAVGDAEINSLDHPRYEFFYPWDYAIDKEKKFLANHEFIIELKRRAHADYLAELGGRVRDPMRLRQTFAAEFRYLSGFGKFLGGMSIPEQYRVFDDVLSVAPWNDSLRARIYAQYRYIATSQRNPAERARLMKRADALYESGTED